MSETKLPTLALVVVAALVGGVAGAGATWGLSRKTGAAAKLDPDKSSAARAQADEGEAMAYRLDRLENDLRALRKQKQSTEALRKYAGVLDKQGDKAGAPSDASTGGALDRPVDAEDPSFELAVRTVLDRVDWEREEERKVTETKRREERAQRQTELLTERLKLTPAQTQKVQQILVEQMDTFRGLREGGDAGATRPSSRSEWRTRVEAIRTETERRLGQVLDDEQMASYRAFADEEGFGPRRGRGSSGADNDENR
ncbi:MAG TPA: hypothetical protein VFU02_22710 [Polyangiaceae bacterium]|nr:hypothetical protein [Polyangiaceae bacterium]